jgi:hypothetical protein
VRRQIYTMLEKANINDFNERIEGHLAFLKHS